MSRIGSAPVKIPAGVTINQGSESIEVKGKLGVLSMPISDAVTLEVLEGALHVLPKNKTQAARMMWGTTQRLLQNLVSGVDQGFKKELEIQGVGYRAAVQGKNLILTLGFSHEVNFPIPDGVKVTCAKPTTVLIEGIDRQLIGQVAAKIRAFRPPEPYKGKGVRYLNEHVVRKEGKKK